MLMAWVLISLHDPTSEIGSAIPHNGGAYNVLLITAPRGIALFAATLTLVSYIATG